METDRQKGKREPFPLKLEKLAKDKKNKKERHHYHHHHHQQQDATTVQNGVLAMTSDAQRKSNTVGQKI